MLQAACLVLMFAVSVMLVISWEAWRLGGKGGARR